MNDSTPNSATAVMDVLGEQNTNFPTNQDIGEQSADDVLVNDTEGESGDVRIGSIVVSTTGAAKSLSVPHDKLVDKMRSLGFPSRVIPDKTDYGKAFTRAKDGLDEQLPDHFSYDGNDATIEMWSDGWYTKHIVVEYIDRTAKTVTVGRIDYDPETETVSTDMNEDIEDESLIDFWDGVVVPKINDLFEYHRNHHNADDISRIRDLLNQQSPGAIKLRRAVYFYPATTTGFDQVLESFRQLYNWLNSYKTRGEDVEFFYTPIFNREADKEFVTDKLEDQIESEMEAIIEEVADKLTEDDTAEELAEDILEPALQDMDSTVKEYEAISESTPRLRRMLEQTVSEMNADVESRARKVIEKTEQSDTPEHTSGSNTWQRASGSGD